MSAVVSPPPVSTIDLPYEGPSAREARHWARGVLVLAEVVDDETIDDVVRCFAEAVSNSQVHTDPSLDRKEITCRLVMTMAEVVTIRGEVIDAGSPDKRPTARQVSPYADTGRGLSQVVKACADEWGYERTPTGEGTTWFIVRSRPGPLQVAQRALITEPKLSDRARASGPTALASDCAAGGGVEW